MVEGVELRLVHYKSVMNIDGGGVEFGHAATNLIEEPQATFVLFRFKIRPDEESGVKAASH